MSSARRRPRRERLSASPARRIPRCSDARPDLRYSTGMLSVEDASRAVAGRIERLASERVALREARGRVLATDVRATRPLPGFDNSAMDGYAARSGDLPGTLPVSAQIGAGQVGDPVAARTAVRIMTGAPMPAGVDTVVIQED